jgi:hypothetical protein
LRSRNFDNNSIETIPILKITIKLKMIARSAVS